MARAYAQALSIQGAPLGETNPLPVFRNPNHDRTIHYLDSVPSEKRTLAGFDTGYRVLPYRMQDGYTRQRRELTFQSIVLENDLLRAIFLPELGGRLISLEYKPAQRELLARNPIFQPANLAIRNAWFSGGIEWNPGQYGHALTTCSPVHAAITQAANGEQGLRLYDFERCKGLFWQIDFWLPEGSPFLIAFCRALNPNPTDTSLYWWNNIAVEEKPDVRVLAPSLKVIYVDFSQEVQSYGMGTMPFLPTTVGRDASYATNFGFASEYFYQCEDAELPWEAALDGEGRGLIEASSHPVSYRKMFCWGMHAGGRHWQDFLSLPNHPYLEIQSGMTPTQSHGLPLPANSTKEWVQLFGYFEADAARVHDKDYAAACDYVDGRLKQQLPAARVADLLAECRANANLAPAEILFAATGWGAVEMARRALEPELPGVPAAFVFPAQTVTVEEEKWLRLLDSGRLAEPDPSAVPGEWMVQPEWLPRLAAIENKHWFEWLHEGVMRMENGDTAGAVAAWQSSIAQRPSPWAYRNLAVAADRAGDAQAAQKFYAKAWEMAVALDVQSAPLAVECLQSLLAQRKFDEGLALYESLPETVRDFDRVQILRGRIALEMGDLETVERVLQREYAVIREGETELSDLWTEMWSQREAERTGRPLDEALRREVRKSHPLPSNIDFLMFEKE
jgi:tetratricopeptide (TPR) repeat protein